MTDWIQRLGKWRVVFTGRLLGTRLITDPQARGARDWSDKLNALRVEGKMISELLISQGIFTEEEFAAAIRAESPAQAEAVHDIFETTLLSRAQVNAITFLLLEKGVIDQKSFVARYQEECRWLCEQYEREFPGFRATDTGMQIHAALAALTMKGWPH